jgi:hypothetical protein
VAVCFWLPRYHLKCLQLLAFHSVRGGRKEYAPGPLRGCWQRSYRRRNSQQNDRDMITETRIRAAMRSVAGGEKTRIELRDSGARAAGRLLLIVRGNGASTTPTAEFFAAWYRAGKRVMSKLGSFPVISLADARKRFREEFSPTISAGGEPTSASARRRHRKEAGTIGELFGAYVASLKAGGKRSADRVEYLLLAAGSAIGAERPAAEVAGGSPAIPLRPSPWPRASPTRGTGSLPRPRSRRSGPGSKNMTWTASSRRRCA